MSHDDAADEVAAKRVTKRERPLWLTRNVWTLSWVSFLQDAAAEMLYPLMPIFLNSVLGAPAAVVGVIEGLAEGTAATVKLLSARINRWMPRKSMVFVGYSLAAIGKVIIAAANIWPVVLAGRVTDRLGKGLRSAPRDAILFVGTSSPDRGKVIGFHRTADTLGAVVGPAVALILLALFDNNVRPVLWIAVIPGVAAALLVLVVRDAETRPERPARNGRHTPRRPQGPARSARAADASLPALTPALSPSHRLDMPDTEIAPERQEFSGKLPRRLDRLITVLSIFALVNFPDALLLLHLSQEGLTATEVVGAYLLFNIAYATLSFPAGYLADRWRPGSIYALGLACFAIAYGGLALTTDLAVSLILVVIYGGFSAANDTVGKSWAAKLAPGNLQLVAQARLQGFAGYGILVAGLWAGLLWVVGPGMGFVPLIIAAIAALVVMGFVLFFERRIDPKREAA